MANTISSQAQVQNPRRMVREGTPEPQIIPSQHRLQRILEAGNVFNGINQNDLAYFQAQGLIFSNSDGELFLATPYKKNKGQQ